MPMGGQPMQPMMQQPMVPAQQQTGYPGQGQPMQQMQPNVPIVMPEWRPVRGPELYRMVDPYSVRQQGGGQPDLGTATNPVNLDYDPAEMVGVPAPEAAP